MSDAIDRYPITNKPKSIIIPQGINNEYYSYLNVPIVNKLLCVGGIGQRKGQIPLVESIAKVKVSIVTLIILN